MKISYKDLNPKQKKLFDSIEKIFVENKVVEKKDFLLALELLLEKYRKRKKKELSLGQKIEDFIIPDFQELFK
jgi:hypothetical protein